MEESNINYKSNKNNKIYWKGIIITIIIFIILFIIINSCSFNNPYNIIEKKQDLNTLTIIVEPNFHLKELSIEVRFYDKNRNLVQTEIQKKTDLSYAHYYSFTYELKFSEMLKTHTYEIFTDYMPKLPRALFQSCLS